MTCFGKLLFSLACIGNELIAPAALSDWMKSRRFNLSTYSVINYKQFYSKRSGRDDTYSDSDKCMFVVRGILRDQTSGAFTVFSGEVPLATMAVLYSTVFLA